MVNEQLTDRVREALVNATDVTEKRMFGGICFMVDDKMCICVRDNQLMCRVGPDEYETAVEENGARAMIHGGRNMKGYVYVDADFLNTTKEFDYWVNTCLAYNKIAKASGKRR